MTALPATINQSGVEEIGSADSALDEYGLTAKQRRFADALLTGASSQTEAARAAGCEGDYAHVYATRAMRSRAVQEYLRASVGHTLALGSVKAVNTMLSLLGDRSGQVRFWASRDLLDRAGFMAKPTETAAPTVTINIDLS